MKKMVYQFHEGTKEMKAILGGKGSGLAEMAKMGIPVPPGFTISTEVCEYYYQNQQQYPKELWEEVKSHLHQVELDTGKSFGNPMNPLLVSVRSGAAVRHDGHNPRPGTERGLSPRSRRKDKQPPFRLGQVPPPHQDV